MKYKKQVYDMLLTLSDIAILKNNEITNEEEFIKEIDKIASEDLVLLLVKLLEQKNREFEKAHLNNKKFTNELEI